MSEGGLFSFPSGGPALLDLADQFFQSRDGESAVVGSAQDFLHGFDGRIQLLAKWRREAGGQDFHGIAQPFSRDSNLMQVIRISQIPAGRFVERPDQRKKS